MNPSKAPSEEASIAVTERWEYMSYRDGTWQPCRNVRDAAMWAADGWEIRCVEVARAAIKPSLEQE